MDLSLPHCHTFIYNDIICLASLCVLFLLYLFPLFLQSMSPMLSSLSLRMVHSILFILASCATFIVLETFAEYVRVVDNLTTVNY